jgi:hypothetical protein
MSIQVAVFDIFCMQFIKVTSTDVSDISCESEYELLFNNIVGSSDCTFRIGGR